MHWLLAYSSPTAVTLIFPGFLTLKLHLIFNANPKGVFSMAVLHYIVKREAEDDKRLQRQETQSNLIIRENFTSVHSVSLSFYNYTTAS